MKIDKETQEKLQDLQLAEQNLQNFLMQKQAFQIELNETEEAIEEVKKTEEEVYKIAGQIMIRAKKAEILKELEEKRTILGLRIKSIENQEKNFSEKSEKLKREIEAKLKKAEK